MGTLGVAGYREAVDAVRALARRAGKRTYTLLVGKPSPAKLANFPEIEVFVLVADPQARPSAAASFQVPRCYPYCLKSCSHARSAGVALHPTCFNYLIASLMHTLMPLVPLAFL